MPNPQFPDLVYLLSKSYEGTNRQDFAELSAGYMRRVKYQLQEYKPVFSNRINQTTYDTILETVILEVDELEKYFDNFHYNRSRILQSEAQEILESLREHADQLKQLSEAK